MIKEPNYPRRRVSWKQIQVQVLQLARWAKPQQFQGIAAISRGGLIPGVMLSHYLGLPMDVVIAKRYNTGRMYVEKYRPKWFRTLVVDDIVDEGYTMRKVKSMFKGVHIGLTASLYYDPSSIYWPDYLGCKVHPDEWLVFPWEEF
jgi:xanthine phosphoribosyltransferase